MPLIVWVLIILGIIFLAPWMLGIIGFVGKLLIDGVIVVIGVLIVLKLISSSGGGGGPPAMA
jgi:hypothetical protein